MTVLVDGQRLLDAGARHNLRSEILLMLQALLDGGALRSGQQLVLVLTKLDAVQASPHLERAQNDFVALEAQVRGAFNKAFAGIRVCAVAASPSSAAMAHGAGVPDVLAWAAPAAKPSAIPGKAPVSTRAFARLPFALGAEDDAGD